MLLNVNHISRYHYDDPVQYALQQIRLTPKQRAGQNVINWSIQVDGGHKELSFEDQHSNVVDVISIEPGTNALTITCKGQVELSDGSGVVGQHGGFAPLWLFQRSTMLTKAGAGITAMVRKLDDDSSTGLDRAHALSALVRENVAFTLGVTHSATTAEEALERGEGVCQDHAHVFLAAARLMGFPARYVSGYLMMNDRIEQDATHAWVEAYIDNLGWVGFDVANGYSPDERYVRVATGLDYREAAPISGMRFGNSVEKLSVELQVQQ